MSEQNGEMTNLHSMVMRLVEMGVRLTLGKGDGGTCAAFENGFYKSDGCATLQCANGKVVLKTRYGRVDEIDDPMAGFAEKMMKENASL